MTKPLITITEAAEMLGVSVATAYRMAAAGQLPTMQLGEAGSRRVIRSKLVELYGIDGSESSAA